MAQQSAAEAGMQQQAYEAARQGQSAITGGLVGGAASFLGSMSDKNVKNLSSASDKEVKTSISRADSKMQEYLQSLRNGANGSAFVGEGYPVSGNYSNKGGSLGFNNEMSSHSPAGNKDLGQEAATPPAPATDTAVQNTAVSEDNKSKKSLEAENARLTSLLQGIKTNQAAPVPGFMGGAAAGAGLGVNIANSRMQHKVMEQQLANKGKPAQQQTNSNVFSGNSELGANVASPMNSGQTTGMIAGMSEQVGSNSPAPDMSSHSPAGSKNLGGKMQNQPAKKKYPTLYSDALVGYLNYLL